MRTVCAINNFNYGRFLGDCLSSALKQNFDQIIVVDDGSTDDSADIIKKYAHANKSILPIIKKNGGQLSCFEAILPYIKPDDCVFFLDSDDLMPNDYLQGMMNVITKIEADFYFCKAVSFENSEAPISNAIIDTVKFNSLPISSALTRVTQRWVGAQTSAIALKGKLLHRMLPYPYAYEWKVRADDLLIFASAILGARKVHIPSIGFAYRIHGNNLYSGNATWKNRKSRASHREKVARLFHYYCKINGMARVPTWKEVKNELQSITDHSEA